MIDLHIHTTAGSADSNLRPPVLRERALALGLPAVMISEHFRVWNDVEAAELAGDTGLVVLRGMEWNTELGHILVIGVEQYHSDLRNVAELRRYVDDCGGVMIGAHPFRHAFDPIPALWKAQHSDVRSTPAATRSSSSSMRWRC
jgi:predicted metal-dependent phosphoesterase TrpH